LYVLSYAGKLSLLLAAGWEISSKSPLCLVAVVAFNVAVIIEPNVIAVSNEA